MATVIARSVLRNEIPGLLQDIGDGGRDTRKVHAPGYEHLTMGELLHHQLAFAVAKALDNVHLSKRNSVSSRSSRKRAAFDAALKDLLADIRKVQKVAREAHLEDVFDSKARRLAIYLRRKYDRV